jgi:hypothetical protein
MRPSVTAEELRALRRKYTEVARLRTTADDDLGERRRVAMARLSTEFPGALREADLLSPSELASRLRALDEALEGAPPAAWMVVIASYHRLARGALAAKRWVRAERAVDEETAARFVAACASGPLGAEALGWGDALGLVHRPPGGRLSTVVLARVARDVGLPVDEVTLLVRGEARARLGATRGARG